MAVKPLILIADDDAEDRFMMAQTFQELGYSDIVIFTEDGSLLLELLFNKSNKDVGLIILDLNMPRMNGTETLKAIKAHPEFSHIPVIIYSTSVNEIEKSNCMMLGATNYITKPSLYNDYLETCRQFYFLSAGVTAQHMIG